MKSFLVFLVLAANLVAPTAAISADEAASDPVDDLGVHITRFGHRDDPSALPRNEFLKRCSATLSFLNQKVINPSDAYIQKYKDHAEIARSSLVPRLKKELSDENIKSQERNKLSKLHDALATIPATPRKILAVPLGVPGGGSYGSRGSVANVPREQQRKMREMMEEYGKPGHV